jgi:glycosyltransferase involved in cell wall biosynthesis
VTTPHRPLKIYVYAIAKNEELFIDRFLDGAAPADGVVIADTGSTDHTCALARRRVGVRVHPITITPWRFDMARNIALNYVPPDADVCVSVDIDEVLQPGWRDEIERVWTPGTTRLRFLFDHGQGRFMSDKIHARHGYWWRMPCHEHLAVDPRVREVFAETPALLMVHRPDPSKSRAQYLDLLRVAHREDPENSRALYYLGRELCFRECWSEAVEILWAYVKGSKWPNERAHGYEMLSQAYLALKNPNMAMLAIQKNLSNTPGRRESWVALADFHRQYDQWVECAAAAHKALSITKGQDDWPSTQSAWTWQVPDLIALSAYFLGDYPKAIDFGTQALAADPNNERLQRNLDFYLEKKPQGEPT